MVWTVKLITTNSLSINVRHSEYSFKNSILVKLKWGNRPEFSQRMGKKLLWMRLRRSTRSFAMEISNTFLALYIGVLKHLYLHPSQVSSQCSLTKMSLKPILLCCLLGVVLISAAVADVPSKDEKQGMNLIQTFIFNLG